MNTCIKAILSLTLWAVCITAVAQKNGEIKGALVDADTQESIPFATVSLLKDKTPTDTGTTSDFDGKFQIGNLSSGNYSLVISFIGYTSDTIHDLNISAVKNSIDIGVVQMGQASEALAEVEVTATSRTVTTKINRKTYFIIRKEK